MPVRVIIVEKSEARSSAAEKNWLEPFSNLLGVIQNTFAQFLNVASTLVRLVFTFDEREVFEIVDKYYDRMKSIDAKASELMAKIEEKSGDMNLFSFLFNPAGAITTRVLSGGPGSLRNFIDYYKEVTGVSLNPFDIGPPGARDSASLMNNRINFAMGYGYGGAAGGGRGTASSRAAQQLQRRLDRVFGINVDPRSLSGGMRSRPASPGGFVPPTPTAPPRVETFAGSGLPILVEAADADISSPLSDAEFKKAVEHFMKQIDFSKLGVKSSANKIQIEMDQMASELSAKIEKPYILIQQLSQVKDTKSLYAVLGEMTKSGFKVQGLDSLKPQRIESLVDETIEKAEDQGKMNELFSMSTVKPKDPNAPTDEEKKAAATEIVTKTVISRVVTESKTQVESAMVSLKDQTLKKFDETFLPKNKEDAKLLLTTDFGQAFKKAKSKIENTGIQIQKQVSVDTTS
jgi:hypothetical protein